MLQANPTNGKQIRRTSLRSDRSPRATRRCPGRYRRLLCETLEQRQLLSASPDLPLLDASSASFVEQAASGSDAPLGLMAYSSDSSSAAARTSSSGAGRAATLAADGEAGALGTTPSATL